MIQFTRGLNMFAVAKYRSAVYDFQNMVFDVRYDTMRSLKVVVIFLAYM